LNREPAARINLFAHENRLSKGDKSPVIEWADKPLDEGNGNRSSAEVNETCLRKENLLLLEKPSTAETEID